MTQINSHIDDDKKIDIDSFYSDENILELRNRIERINNGTSTLSEHELIEDYD